MTDHLIEDLRTIARRWQDARDRIVRARNSAEEADIFRLNQGTHMDFLRAKETADMEIAGALTAHASWSPEEINAFSELVSGWNSRVQTARNSMKGRS